MTDQTKPAEQIELTTPSNPSQTIVGQSSASNGCSASPIPGGQIITVNHPIWYMYGANTTGQWITVSSVGGSTAYVGTMGIGTVVCDDPGTAVSVPVKDQEGCKCVKCDEFYPYGKSNQLNGTLICYACRHNL